MKITDLVSHYYCDDPWYSCPLAEGGCADERETECFCGYDKKIERIKQWALEMVELPEGYAEHYERRELREELKKKIIESTDK